MELCIAKFESNVFLIFALKHFSKFEFKFVNKSSLSLDSNKRTSLMGAVTLSTTTQDDKAECRQ